MSDTPRYAIKPFHRTIGYVRVYDNKMTITGGSELPEECVSFIPGMGNGNYEVSALIQHVPGVGPRITSVNIELISQEELKWMDRELLEPDNY